MFLIGEEASDCGFFANYIAALSVLTFYILWKPVRCTPYVRAQEIDLVSRLGELDIKEILAELGEGGT